MGVQSPSTDATVCIDGYTEGPPLEIIERF